MSGTPNLTGGGDGANVLVNGDVYAPKGQIHSTLQYLNKAAFVKVPVAASSGATVRPGNLGNGAVRLPGLWNVDSSVSKAFMVKESVRLQLRAEMFKFFNHTNFNAVTTDINSANFGRFTGSAGTRVIQLNARISF